MSRMPVLPVDEMVAYLDGSEEKVLRAAFNSRTGALRATKPFRITDYNRECALFEACANYVWRMLCFDFCDFTPHSCMPVTADFDLYSCYRDYAEKHERVKTIQLRLDDLIKRAETNIPVTAMAGVMRWRKLV